MKKKLILVISIVLAAIYFYFSQLSFDKSLLKNNSNGEVQIIGHAGLGFVSFIPFNPYPANSFISLKKALKYNGCDGIEVDLQMTKDGEFVLFHDERLDESSNLNGCISQLNLQEVLNGKYQVGWPFDWIQYERIISLDSLVGYLKTLKKFPVLHIDIRNKSKCFNPEENAAWEYKMAQRLIQKLNDLKIEKSKILLISLSMEFTTHLNQLHHSYPTSFEIVANEQFLFDYAFNGNFESITIKPKILTPAISQQIHAKGLKVFTFGAKSKVGNKKLLELNPDGIQTNNLEALLDLLED